MKHRRVTFLRSHPVLAVVAAVIGLAGSGAIASTVSMRAEPRRPDVPVAQEIGSRLGGGAGPAGADPAHPGGAPSSQAAHASPAAGQTRRCTVGAKLVPTCGLLWGVAPGAFTDLPAARALANFERTTGRHADILHSYHRGDEVFPTADEIAAVRQPKKRILFANWKVAWGTTWADVAAGGQDARIDRAAERLKAFPGTLFLAPHHEPENDVRSGGGMTAKDYAAMFRHTVERLRARGVTNVVFVLAYMAYEPWCVQPWFDDLYPGDDVVDWIGMDPYLYAKPGGYGYGDFSYLVNRTSDPAKWPGFYNWVTRTHGNKPLMVAEWGVYEHTADPAQKAWIFSTVGRQLAQFPAIKALVYFDSPHAPKGDTRPDSSDSALAEFRRLAESTVFSVTL
ncbi:endoglucanase [Dactylosporangium roseum]|uniref:Endoglucanase n=1 Tax=Dactylosporangium roseum TaxID=47989 RepID=A0ABY5Z681_9ACTN|nr:glycosyl hydrolase [Dactylosporangium roseum]UWZ37570.1 endoglucanase [Dactylosporangium roseum]